MKVKRTSWHYKICHIGSDYENNNDNLCSYFWVVVGKIALFGSAGLLLCVLAYYYFTDPFVLSTSILILSILLGVALPIVVIHYIRQVCGKSIECPGESIVIEFVKAQKDKVCPLIEYIN